MVPPTTELVRYGPLRPANRHADRGVTNMGRMETLPSAPPAVPSRGIENCPANRAIEALGDKWKLLIVIELEKHGRMRFGALHTALHGINQKVLTTALRGLERDGIVDRHAYVELPPRVEYSLTPRGEAASSVVKALDDWAVATGI